MQIEIKVFSEEEKQLVHKRTMEILSETGVWIKSDKAFFALRDAGARTDAKRRIVYFTEEMVQSALAAAPKEFVLGGRNPAYDYPLPSKESRHLMSGITTNIYDPYTGERRESTKADVVNVGRIFQHAETGVACWTGCSAGDVPEKTHCLHEMAAIIEGTSKHVQFELASPYEASFAGEILEAVLGSAETVRQRKIASVLYCPVSPLTQDKNMLEAYLELASGAADPVTGAYVKSGEAALVSLGGTEMARFYGLPCAVTGGGSFETMPAYLGRADLIDGIGTTDNGMAVSLEMILTEDEIAKRCLRIGKGIRVGENTDLTADIKAEGPGGTFLAHKSSIKNFRNPDELYYSKMFPSKLRATTYEKRDSIEIANRRVRQILEGPVVDALPDEVKAKIDAICQRADETIFTGNKQ